MSVFVRAKMIKSDTKFLDEECLIQALKNKNLQFHITNSTIKIISPNIEILKKGSSFSLTFVGEELYGNSVGTPRETEETKNARTLISSIEKEYEKILDEKIERLSVETEMKERQNAIIAEREIKRLERIKRKREMEKKKMIDEKVEKLRERAKMLGYEVEEKVENNERVMVLVRRR